jgi:glycosyltransferase involved in cell wall biosynthesis
MNDFVSVVVPTFDQRYLARTLAGLEEQTRKNFEVIVVENGLRSSRTSQVLASWTGNCELRYIFESRLGTNVARNAGVESANGPIIALLDDDCLPAGDWIESISSAYEKNQEAEIIGGRVTLEFENEKPIWCLNPFPQFLSEVDWGELTRLLGDDEWLAGANLTFKKSTHEILGGFRENFGQTGRSDIQLGNDELEFYQRALAHSRKSVLYSPDIRVEHFIPETRCTIESLESRRVGQGISDIASLRAGKTLEIHRDDLFEAVWHILKCHFWPYSGTVSETSSLVFLYYLVRCHVAYTDGMIQAILDHESKYNRDRMLMVMHKNAEQGFNEGSKVFMSDQDVHEIYMLADNFIRARGRSIQAKDDVLVYNGYLTGLLNKLTAVKNAQQPKYLGSE